MSKPRVTLTVAMNPLTTKKPKHHCAYYQQRPQYLTQTMCLCHKLDFVNGHVECPDIDECRAIEWKAHGSPKRPKAEWNTWRPVGQRARRRR